MKILKVIHGYPPYYNAGSEIYSEILSHELAEKHEIQIFSRFENSFSKDFQYKTILDSKDPRIILNMVNVPRSKHLNKLIHSEIDEIFKKLINSFKPDIIHFGHLSHLSLSLPVVASDITQIFTLHDFWLSCPKGRFIQRNSEDLYELCNGQENKKCATKCYSGNFIGNDDENDILYWEKWVRNRMGYVRNILTHIDHFIAPSKFLMNKFINDFSIPSHKISYLDYGFDLSRLKGRTRDEEKTLFLGI